MSAVETPPAPTPPPPETDRRCPRCDAHLEPDQDWCLNCGADVGSRIAAPSGWRVPVAIVGLLLAIAVAALILALVELAGDPERIETVQVPAPTAAATPAPSVAPDATATPESELPPPATDDGTVPPGGPEIAEWPSGKSGWTVVVESAATDAAAQSRAKELGEQGVPVGILDSDDFASLTPGRFIVFSGQYENRREAQDALAGITATTQGAYVQRVAPE